jgi:hypothetical protein
VKFSVRCNVRLFANIFNNGQKLTPFLLTIFMKFGNSIVICNCVYDLHSIIVLSFWTAVSG